MTDDTSVLLNVLIMNTAAAGLIALAAWSVSLVAPRRPQLSHLCWWLVLIKLVTPPIVEIPVQTESVLPASIASWSAPISIENPLTIESPQIVHRYSADPSVPAIEQSAPPIVQDITAIDTSFTIRPNWRGILLTTAVAIAAGILVVTWRRCRAFGRWIHVATTADKQWTRRLSENCERAGLRAPATVRLADATLPPMLWGFGRNACVVLPKKLIDGSPASSIDAVLLHEAAHYHRGDHYLRVLEIVIGTLLWWHPLAWIARRNLRHSEERCCDAIVVNALSGQEREYAATLVECVGLLANTSVPRAVGATPFASKTQLRRRIKMIVSTRPHARLGVICLSTLLAMAAAVLATSVSMSASSDRSGPERNAADRPALPARVPEKAIEDADDYLHSAAFTPAVETSAPIDISSLPGNIDRNSIIGCWGRRFSDSASLAAAFGANVVHYDLLILNNDGLFERRESSRIGGITLTQTTLQGYFLQTSGQQIRFKHPGREGLTLSGIVESQKPRNTLNDVIEDRHIILDGDVLTMVHQLNDGTQNVSTYRRLTPEAATAGDDLRMNIRRTSATMVDASISTKIPPSSESLDRIRAIKAEILRLEEARNGLIELVPAMTTHLQKNKLVEGLLPIARKSAELERELLRLIAGRDGYVDDHIKAGGSAFSVSQNVDRGVAFLFSNARTTSIERGDGGYRVVCAVSVENGGDADLDDMIQLAVMLPEGASLTGQSESEWIKSDGGMYENAMPLRLPKQSEMTQTVSFFVPESSKTPLFTVVAQVISSTGRHETQSGKTIAIELPQDSR